ncbi:urokinase plasminogen activator surface receptor-like isoform X2 [Mobula birostris]|uniref:urokinase plasminogen activator surface receptor-like isoform X2 n=1 Tax=Mobula birostris TaxID=1983395 RepID=UPI003B289C27
MHAKMRTLLALALFLGLVAQAHSLQCYSCHSPGENCSLGQRNNTCNDTLNHTCITYTSRIKLSSPISEKENMTLNGLECEGCLTIMETMCNESMATVSCHGEQNRCIHATANFRNTTYITKGCASESLCNERSIIPYFPFKLSNVTCCQENRCNKGSQDNPQTTTPGKTTSSPITQAPTTPAPTTPAPTTSTDSDNNTASALNTQRLLIVLLPVLWAIVL